MQQASLVTVIQLNSTQHMYFYFSPLLITSTFLLHIMEIIFNLLSKNNNNNNIDK